MGFVDGGERGHVLHALRAAEVLAVDLYRLRVGVAGGRHAAVEAGVDPAGFAVYLRLMPARRADAIGAEPVFRRLGTARDVHKADGEAVLGRVDVRAGDAGAGCGRVDQGVRDHVAGMRPVRGTREQELLAGKLDQPGLLRAVRREQVVPAARVLIAGGSRESLGGVVVLGRGGGADQGAVLIREVGLPVDLQPRRLLPGRGLHHGPA